MERRSVRLFRDICDTFFLPGERNLFLNRLPPSLFFSVEIREGRTRGEGSNMIVQVHCDCKKKKLHLKKKTTILCNLCHLCTIIPPSTLQVEILYENCRFVLKMNYTVSNYRLKLLPTVSQQTYQPNRRKSRLFQRLIHVDAYDCACR
eukprot:Lithocolla_globosa_v1_NODE_8442_length_820_cov_67.725490.p2 type:complete len:148 gc:universal NODE_8442_length_820_cov_67.725490:229-672(+)